MKHHPPHLPRTRSVSKTVNNFFSPLLAFSTQKIATHSTDIVSAVCVAIFWIVNASRNEKSCLQFLIPTAVFHMLLRRGSTSPLSHFRNPYGAAFVAPLWALSVEPRLKGKLNTDTSPQNFWTTFLENDLTEKLKNSAVANAIAIPLPLCFSCFILLRRFRENLMKPFYFYLSRTCGSPGGTLSVISLALRGDWHFAKCVQKYIYIHGVYRYVLYAFDDLIIWRNVSHSP